MINNNNNSTISTTPQQQEYHSSSSTTQYSDQPNSSSHHTSSTCTSSNSSNNSNSSASTSNDNNHGLYLNEIWSQILLFIPMNRIVESSCLIHKSLYDYTMNSDAFWRELIHRDFECCELNHPLNDDSIH